MPRKKKLAKKPAAPPTDDRTRREKQKEFLSAYSDTFSIEKAALLAGVARANHFRWIQKDERYAKAFANLKETAGSFLEAEAITRAGDGWFEPVFYQGNECGQVRRFDSGLMQFLLRGLMPEKYGAKTEISGPEGSPVQVNLRVNFVQHDESAGS